MIAPRRLRLPQDLRPDQFPALAMQLSAGGLTERSLSGKLHSQRRLSGRQGWQRASGYHLTASVCTKPRVTAGFAIHARLVEDDGVGFSPGEASGALTTALRKVKELSAAVKHLVRS